MLMLPQIFKGFHIFIFYFQVVLIIVGNSLVENQFYGTRHWHVIFNTPCPRGANMRKRQQHGSTASRLKWSRPQDVLPYSLYTTHSPLKLPLAQIKSLFPPKFSHSWITSHWKFFITLECGMQVLYTATN